MNDIHKRQKFLTKKCRNFQEGPGGQISFKMSQEPKTSEKKYWTEVGHISQEFDLTKLDLITWFAMKVTIFWSYIHKSPSFLIQQDISSQE